jgi:hypothetical protein
MHIVVGKVGRTEGYCSVLLLHDRVLSYLTSQSQTTIDHGPKLVKRAGFENLLKMNKRKAILIQSLFNSKPCNTF